MKTYMIQIMIGLLIFTVGCSMNNISSDTNENKNEINSQSINYAENDDEKSPEIDYSNYKQSKRRMAEFKDTDTDHLSTDIFTNEETDKVTNHLRSLSFIRGAQAASTNDRIIVAVILSDHGSRDRGNEIEQEVRKIVKDKEIVVYTDYTEWEQWKDEIQSGGPSQIERNIGDFLEKFFNVEMKR